MPPTQGLGAIWGFSDFGHLVTYRPQAPYIISLELKAVFLAICYWVSVPQGRQIMVVTYNATVVSSINKQGGTEASSVGSGCSNTTLATTVDVHVSSVSLAEQGHSETSSHRSANLHRSPPPGGFRT